MVAIDVAVNDPMARAAAIRADLRLIERIRLTFLFHENRVGPEGGRADGKKGSLLRAPFTQKAPRSFEAGRSIEAG